MIPVSRWAAVCCIALALTLHAASSALFQGQESVQIEGGSGAAMAALGNHFADMVAGTQSPVDAKDLTEITDPDLQPPEVIESVQDPVQDRIDTVAPVPETAVRPETQPVTQPVSEPTTVAALTPLPQALAPVASAVPVLHAAQPPAQAAPADPAPVEPVAPVTPDSVAEALPDTHPIDDQPMTDSPRPQARPDRTAKPAKAPTKPTQKAQAKPKATAQGNSAENGTKGSNTGSTKSKAAAASTGSNKTSKSAGNAAISSYKGKVKRKIYRSARGKSSIRGAAYIELTISGSGSLASVRVVNSSGSNRLDKEALAQVRRAAPFPAPPGGKPLLFTITILGGK